MALGVLKVLGVLWVLKTLRVLMMPYTASHIDVLDKVPAFFSPPKFRFSFCRLMQAPMLDRGPRSERPSQ